jgi:hypothetical protein
MGGIRGRVALGAVAARERWVFAGPFLLLLTVVVAAPMDDRLALFWRRKLDGEDFMDR